MKRIPLTDHKNYFIFNDGIKNLSNDLGFSILKNYICQAGCKHCYARKFFPKKLDASLETVDISFDSRFRELSNIWSKIINDDDLPAFKVQNKALYDFYIRNSHLLLGGGLTDRQWPKMYDIWMNDMNWAGFYEGAFTDEWIVRFGDDPGRNGKEGPINKSIYDIITDYTHKFGKPNTIKIIHTNDEYYFNDRFKDFLDWLDDNHYYTLNHKNIDDDIDYDSYLDETEIDNTSEFYQEDGRLFHILNQSVLLGRDQFIFSFEDSIANREQSFASIDDTKDVKRFLYLMLQGKKMKYGDWSNEILYRNNNVYWEYFRSVSENLTVNEDYNFLPKIVLNTNWKLYDTFKQLGWIETPYGLIESRDALKTPVGLYDWKA